MTRPNRGCRRGYSLIEVVLVVGAISIVLGLCGTLLHGLLRLDRAGRSFLTDTSATARLATQFRTDVRAASDAKRIANPPGIGLTMGDDVVVDYQFDGKRLLRVERAKEAERRRESYDVGRSGPVEFVVAGRRVRLVLDRQSAGGGGPDRPRLLIEATLGKDRALASLTEAKK